jgi:hypothetical protein
MAVHDRALEEIGLHRKSKFKLAVLGDPSFRFCFRVAEHRHALAGGQLTG